MSYQKLDIILPTLDEEETIGKVIDEIPRAILKGKGYQVKVLIVDGDSTDLTRQIAQERDAEVIIEPRRGKGRAMRTAFEQVEVELFTQIVKNGYFIGEVPIYYRRRPTPAKLSSIKDGLTMGWTLITRRF